MILKAKMYPVFILVAMLLVALGLVACSEAQGQLKPLLPESSREGIFAAEPQLVTFSELQEHPEDFKDSLIRLSGSYFRLEAPNCFPVSGYDAEWMLVSEDLRLDAVGFEQLMRLVEEGTILTVDGFFRLYEGPLGCGKAAPGTTAWFLEVLQIVQPNPLLKSGSKGSGLGTPIGSPPIATVPGTATALPPTTQPPITETPQLTSVPTGTPTANGTMPPVGTGTITPTGTRPTTGTPTITPTNQSTGTTTPTPTRTVTPTPLATPPSTSTSGPAPTQPPLPTTYPGPTALPTGYPS
jgi:hypothetical protein